MSENHADPSRKGQLHHVEVNTSDFETSFEFWDWLLTSLGYQPMDRWDGGFAWINGPTYIVLVQAENTISSYDRRAPGLNHLAFHADSRETIDNLTAAIRERDDASVLYEDKHPFAGGYYALYCEDPDGMKIEIVGPE